MAKTLKNILEQSDVHDEFEELQPGEEASDVKLKKDQEKVVESEEEDDADKNESEDEDEDKKDESKAIAERLKQKLAEAKSKLKEDEDEDGGDKKDNVEVDENEEEDEKNEEVEMSNKDNSDLDKGKIKTNESEEEDEEKNESEEEDEADKNESEDDEDEEEVTEKLTEKEQTIIMEALKLPKKAQKDLNVIFESMVARKIKKERELIAEKAERKVEKVKDELVEALDVYAKEVVKKWKVDNAPIFEKQREYDVLKENFNKLSEIFKAVGISTVLSESQISEKYTELSKENQKLLERNQKLEDYVEKIQIRELYESYVDGLSKNQKRKFVSLAESLEFDNVKELKEKLDAIKKLFVESKKYESDELDSEVKNENDDEEDKVDEGSIIQKESKRTDLVSESLKLLSGK